MCRHYFVELQRHVELEEGMLNMDMQPSQRSFKVIAECPITGQRQSVTRVNCVMFSFAFGSVIWE